MKYVKEDLEKLISEDKLSYVEIGKNYNVSDTYIKKVARKLGIILKPRKKNPENFIPHNKKDEIFITCPNCNNEFKLLTWQKQKFCSKKCANEFRSKKAYDDYLLNQEKYCDEPHNMSFIKPYVLIEQNNRCNICEIEPIWNKNKLVFVLDHIDGNASNNMRNNLRLICPNCDSQLDTYKSKNKNSARKKRYLLNYKN